MIKRWITRWLHSNDVKTEPPMSGGLLPRRNYLRFLVHQASGGLIVETETWDCKTDQYKIELHVIAEDQKLTTELDRILFMHKIKQ